MSPIEKGIEQGDDSERVSLTEEVIEQGSSSGSVSPTEKDTENAGKVHNNEGAVENNLQLVVYEPRSCYVTGVTNMNWEKKNASQAKRMPLKQEEWILVNPLGMELKGRCLSKRV